MDLTQTQNELTLLTKRVIDLENDKGMENAANSEGALVLEEIRKSIALNKTATESHATILDYHKQKIQELEAKISKLEDKLIDAVPLKKKKWWQ